MSPLAQQIIAIHKAEKVSNGEIARRLGCKKAWVSQVLKKAGLRSIRLHQPKLSEHVNKACMDGSNMRDPNRADKLLRRFSWQEPLA